MDICTVNPGSWQRNAWSDATVMLAPFATTAAATRLSFAGAGRIDATVGYQPKAVDTQLTHKSMTRPGSPPRGRLR